ncbi:MAG: hypothetical protein AB7O96_16300, partial [Pseudobdellovibrionaceae bacterium]
MKTKNRIQKIILFSLSTFMTAQSFASSSMDIKTPRGESTVQHKSPSSGLIELCTVPQRLSEEAFSEKDRKQEAEVCALSFYGENAICPKQNSTNPGLLVGEAVEGMTGRQIEERYCAGPAKLFKTDYKYKQGISCSYTPSILAYYQIGRILDVGRIPVAMLRTMDRKEHLRQVQMANTEPFTSKMSDQMKWQWDNYLKTHKNGTDTNVFDNSRKFVYGSIVKNVKKEGRYLEVSGRGAYDPRYQRFITQPPFLRVASQSTLPELALNYNETATTTPSIEKELAIELTMELAELNKISAAYSGPKEFAQVAQTVVQAKDVSDMILIDTLFSQADRIGNIHFHYYWYWIDADGKVQKKKSDTEIEFKGKGNSKKMVFDIPKKEQAEFV